MQFSCLAHGTYDADQIHCKGIGVLEEIVLGKFKPPWISKPKQDIQGARNARKERYSVLKFYRNRSAEKEEIMALV